MLTTILENISLLIENSFWLAPVLALVAGLLTSFTPCSLSSIPLIIGYVGAVDTNKNKALKYSIVFAIGSTITFTSLGVIASIFGLLISSASSIWYLFLAILMLLMAIQLLDIFEFIPSSYLVSKTNKRGYLGAFLAGILAGLFSSPCATPVLVVLLGLVAQKASIGWGILLLVLYSIGHSFLVILAGSTTGFVRALTTSSSYGRFSQILKYTMALAVLLISYYLFYLAF